jgi:hypothetical protein
MNFNQIYFFDLFSSELDGSFQRIQSNLSLLVWLRSLHLLVRVIIALIVFLFFFIDVHQPGEPILSSLSIRLLFHIEKVFMTILNNCFTFIVRVTFVEVSVVFVTISTTSLVGRVSSTSALVAVVAMTLTLISSTTTFVVIVITSAESSPAS